VSCHVYREKEFREVDLNVIRACAQIVNEYTDQGIRMTLRQLYYQMIAQDLFPSSWIDAKYNLENQLPEGTKNTIKNYSRLSKLISDARLAGWIDWDAIEDRGRRPQRTSQWDSIRDIIESAIDSFRLPRWADQPSYVELWVEKDALASVLWPIAHRHHITLMVNKGYSSQSAMHEAAGRFIAASNTNKQPTLLYLGDHDPSGEDMVRDIRERLTMFGARDLEVRKIALTKAQILRYNPPPNPAKVTDPRAKKYIAEHGNKSWEVDALPPNVMTRLVDNEMRRYVDQAKMDAILAEEERLKAALKKATLDNKRFPK